MTPTQAPADTRMTPTEWRASSSLATLFALRLLGLFLMLPVFALSLVMGPLLASRIGFGGLFALTGLLALAGIVAVAFWVPPEPSKENRPPAGQASSVLAVLKNPALLRLDVGVLVLHAVQLAMWVAIPPLLVTAGLDKVQHWQIYLPVVIVSFLVMWMTLFPLEKRGYLRAVFLVPVGLILAVQIGFWVGSAAGPPALVGIGVLLFLFFCVFNILEASQPSLASRIAPALVGSAALGLYNTLQVFGFFVGGAAGGWLTKTYGVPSVFAACAAAMLLWLVVAWPMKITSRHDALAAS